MIALDEIALDSSPIPIRVKENKLKTNSADRFNKIVPPRADKEAGLGVLIHYIHGKKLVHYFWGYRNHIICDANNELPLEELTLPANVSEISVAKKLIMSVKHTLWFKRRRGSDAMGKESILAVFLWCEVV